MRIGSVDHSFNRGEKKVVGVDRIRVIDPDLIEDLAEHLQVFVGGSLSQAALDGVTLRAGRRHRDQRDGAGAEEYRHGAPPSAASSFVASPRSGSLRAVRARKFFTSATASVFLP